MLFALFLPLQLCNAVVQLAEWSLPPPEGQLLIVKGTGKIK